MSKKVINNNVLLINAENNALLFNRNNMMLIVCSHCNHKVPNDHQGHKHGLCGLAITRFNQDINNKIWDAYTNYTPEKHEQIKKMVQQYQRSIQRLDEISQRLLTITTKLEQLF